MPSISDIIASYRPDLAPYEELCKSTPSQCLQVVVLMHTDKHFHSHPELSFQEKETAATIVAHLKKLNAYEIHAGIGGHGVAAVLKNGPGKTVLLRADIDGLPVEEMSGLPYASKARMKDLEGFEKPTMHACGHDIHITSLLGAADALAKSKELWQGTLILCFQPAEEKAGGAKAMVEDGLYKKVPEPDLCIGAHVMPLRAGKLLTLETTRQEQAHSLQA